MPNRKLIHWSLHKRRHDSKVVGSSVEYCVVLEGTSIVGIERLEESLVGKHAKVTKHEGNRKILKLNIGDYSELEL